MVMDWKNIFLNVRAIQTDLQTQYNLYQTPMEFFTEIEKNTKICLEPQKTLNSQGSC